MAVAAFVMYEEYQSWPGEGWIKVGPWWVNSVTRERRPIPELEMGSERAALGELAPPTQVEPPRLDPLDLSAPPQQPIPTPPILTPTRDEIGALRGLEGFSAASEALGKTTAQVAQKIATGTARLPGMALRGFQHLGAMQQAGGGESARQIFEESRHPQRRYVSPEEIKEREEKEEEFIQGIESIADKLDVKEAPVPIPGMPGTERIQEVAFQAAESLPTTLGLGGVYKWGGKLLGSAGAFLLEGGQAFRELKDINPVAAPWAGAGVGLVNAALETLGFEFLLRPLKSMTSAAGKKMMIENLLGMIFIEPGTEAAQTAVEAAGRYAAGEPFEKAFENIKEEAATAALIALATGPLVVGATGGAPSWRQASIMRKLEKMNPQKYEEVKNSPLYQGLVNERIERSKERLESEQEKVNEKALHRWDYSSLPPGVTAKDILNAQGDVDKLVNNLYNDRVSEWTVQRTPVEDHTSGILKSIEHQLSVIDKILEDLPVSTAIRRDPKSKALAKIPPIVYPESFSEGPFPGYTTRRETGSTKFEQKLYLHQFLLEATKEQMIREKEKLDEEAAHIGELSPIRYLALRDNNIKQAWLDIAKQLKEIRDNPSIRVVRAGDVSLIVELNEQDTKTLEDARKRLLFIEQEIAEARKGVPEDPQVIEELGGLADQTSQEGRLYELMMERKKIDEVLNRLIEAQPMGVFANESDQVLDEWRRRLPFSNSVPVRLKELYNYDPFQEKEKFKNIRKQLEATYPEDPTELVNNHREEFYNIFMERLNKLEARSKVLLEGWPKLESVEEKSEPTQVDLHAYDKPSLAKKLLRPHAEILSQGVDKWNAWRKEHPEIKPDLPGLGKQVTKKDLLRKKAELEGKREEGTDRLVIPPLDLSIEIPASTKDIEPIIKAKLREKIMASRQELGLADLRPVISREKAEQEVMDKITSGDIIHADFEGTYLAQPIDEDGKKVPLHQQTLNMMQWAYSAFVNQDQAFVRAMKSAKNPETRVQLVKEMIELLGKRRGGPASAMSSLYHFTSKLRRDGRGSYDLFKTGESFTDILEDALSGVKKADRDNFMNKFRNYMMSLKQVEQYEFHPEQVEEKDLKKSKDVIDSFELEMEMQGVDINEIALRTSTWMRKAIIDPLKEIGYLSQEDYDNIVNQNQRYFPFWRISKDFTEDIMADEDLAREIGLIPEVSVSRAIKRAISSPRVEKRTKGLSGGKLSTESFTDIVMKVQAISKFVDRQRILNLLAEGARKDPLGIGAEIKPLGPSHSLNENEVYIWRDGERLAYSVPRDVFQATERLSPKAIDSLMRVAAMPTRLLRITATHTPSFLARNPLRDQIDAAVYGKGYIPFVGLLEGLVNIIGAGKHYKNWIASGGAYASFISMNRDAPKAVIEDLLKFAGSRRHTNDYISRVMQELKGSILGSRKSKARVAGRLLVSPFAVTITGLQELSGLLEEGTRVGVYAAAKRKGLSDLEAMIYSRESTLDFGRMGHIGNRINALHAFFNAQVQSVDRFAREWKDRPAVAALKMFSYASIPAAANWLLNVGDDDYEKQSEHMKSAYFHIYKKANGDWVRYPRSLGTHNIWFGYMLERFFDYANARDPQFKEKLKHALFETFPDLPVPTMIEAPMEASFNYDRFRDRPIEHWSETEQGPNAGIIPPMRVSPTTPLVIREISNRAYKMFGPDNILAYPKKVEHILQGYLAGYGRMLPEWISGIIEASMKEDVKRSPVEKYRGGTFTALVPAGEGSFPVLLFREISTNAKQQAASWDRAIELAGLGHGEVPDIKDFPLMRYAESIADVDNQLREWNETINQLHQAGQFEAARKYKTAQTNYVMAWLRGTDFMSQKRSVNLGILNEAINRARAATGRQPLQPPGNQPN